MTMTSITKTLTAGVLSLTLAMTSLAPTTAQAGLSEEETVGLITLLLLGAAIHNNRRDDDAREYHPRPPQGNVNRRVLPGSCVHQERARGGETIRFYAMSCLNDRYDYVNRLPQACHVQFRNRNNDRRQGFRVGCMNNQGFRAGRH